MARYRVIVVRDVWLRGDVPDADRMVSARSPHAAAAVVLRAIGGGYAESIEVRTSLPHPSRVCFLDCTYCAGEFDYGARFP
jgi:hypothetical protein